jgi:hypothetical protein
LNTHGVGLRSKRSREKKISDDWRNQAIALRILFRAF